MNYPAPEYTGKDIDTPAGQAQDQDFKNMYNWLLFNYYYTFFCLFLVIVVSFIYRSMNHKAMARGHQIAHSGERSKVEEIEMQGKTNTAIN